MGWQNGRKSPVASWHRGNDPGDAEGAVALFAVVVADDTGAGACELVTMSVAAEGFVVETVASALSVAVADALVTEDVACAVADPTRVLRGSTEAVEALDAMEK